MPAAWEWVDAHLGGISPQKGLLDRKFLAILIPHTGEVSSNWFYHTLNLHRPKDSRIFMSRGSPIDIERELLAHQALDAGYEWLFFLDSDVILPPDSLEKLFSCKKKIVTGLYRVKKHGYNWSIWNKIKGPDNKNSFDHIKKWTEKIITCDTTGMGCMLIHRSVFETIHLKHPKLPWFFWTNKRSPSFTETIEVPDPDMKDVGEDFWFCLLAKTCGHEIFVNTDVRCNHVATLELSVRSDHPELELPST